MKQLNEEPRSSQKSCCLHGFLILVPDRIIRPLHSDLQWLINYCSVFCTQVAGGLYLHVVFMFLTPLCLWWGEKATQEKLNILRTSRYALMRSQKTLFSKQRCRENERINKLLTCWHLMHLSILWLVAIPNNHRMNSGQNLVEKVPTQSQKTSFVLV